MDRFKAGDRVVHVTESQVPEGALGTVLGRAPYGDLWEVEYDGIPCPHFGREAMNARSKTSWYSRDESIELTREEALARST